MKFWEISDSFWERVAPLIPQSTREPGKVYRRLAGGGRKPLDPRKVFSAIIYVLRTGIQWKSLPKELYGSPSSIHAYFKKWEEQGFFEELWKKGLAEFEEMKGIHWEWTVDTAKAREFARKAAAAAAAASASVQARAAADTARARELALKATDAAKAVALSVQARAAADTARARELASKATDAAASVAASVQARAAAMSESFKTQLGAGASDSSEKINESSQSFDLMREFRVWRPVICRRGREQARAIRDKASSLFTDTFKS